VIQGSSGRVTQLSKTGAPQFQRTLAESTDLRFHRGMSPSNPAQIDEHHEHSLLNERYTCMSRNQGLRQQMDGRLNYCPHALVRRTKVHTVTASPPARQGAAARRRRASVLKQMRRPWLAREGARQLPPRIGFLPAADLRLGGVFTRGLCAWVAPPRRVIQEEKQ
jgi:hypothetical protein